jgi:hypothetical protein
MPRRHSDDPAQCLWWREELCHSKNTATELGQIDDAGTRLFDVSREQAF